MGTRDVSVPFMHASGSRGHRCAGSSNHVQCGQAPAWGAAVEECVTVSVTVTVSVSVLVTVSVSVSVFVSQTDSSMC